MQLPRLLILTLATLVASATQAKEAPRVPAPEGVLPVVVVESLVRPGNAFTDFDRLDLGLRKVAKQRKWPLKIAAERLVDGVPSYLTELNISLTPLREEAPGEYVVRAWTMLHVDGKKHDFGIVTYRHNRHIGWNLDSELERIFDGAAVVIADRIEPLLFPDLKQEQKK